MTKNKRRTQGQIYSFDQEILLVYTKILVYYWPFEHWKIQFFSPNNLTKQDLSLAEKLGWHALYRQ